MAVTARKMGETIFRYVREERRDRIEVRCGACACVGEGEDGVESFRLAADVTRMDGGWHLTHPSL